MTHTEKAIAALVVLFMLYLAIHVIVAVSKGFPA